MLLLVDDDSPHRQIQTLIAVHIDVLVLQLHVLFVYCLPEKLMDECTDDDNTEGAGPDVADARSLAGLGLGRIDKRTLDVIVRLAKLMSDSGGGSDQLDEPATRLLTSLQARIPFM